MWPLYDNVFLSQYDNVALLPHHMIQYVVPPLYPTVDVVFLLYKVKLAG